MTRKEEIEKKAEKLLEEIRPFLQQDEGDVELVRFEEETSVLEVKLLGNCRTCPMSLMTLRAGIERYLLKSMPEIRRIEAV